MVRKNRPLTKAEVKNVILQFFKLNAAKAHVAEFIPIVDEKFRMELKEKGKTIIAFDGLAGLQEHQDGKAPIFYDQKFVLQSIKIKISNKQARAETISQWHSRQVISRSARSKKLIANLKHIWLAKRSPTTGRAILTLHTCYYFKYVPGFKPTEKKEEFHLTLD